MTTDEIIAVAAAISIIFLVVFKFLLSKVQSEFRSFKVDLKDFQKEITTKLNNLDKMVAVKSNVIDFMHKEIENLKKRFNNCKHCRGVSDE